MSMTRQHFVLIAEAINTERNYATTDEQVATLDSLTSRFASMLYTTNARFNRDKFLTAAGIGIGSKGYTK